MQEIRLIIIILFTISLLSCATKKIELPEIEKPALSVLLAERQRIKRVEAIFSVEFEKDDSTMSGEAAAEITEKTLNLRIYSMGFLVGEIKEENGVITSKPERSKNQSLILINGLRSSIMWWLIKNYNIAEFERTYTINNSSQYISVDKSTMLPVTQTIELNEGRELSIFYEEPIRTDGIWYQSKMRIKLLKYTVRLKIKDIIFIY
ncbi:MAG: hypothetical protein LLF28_03785 [Nitrospiraceae bacterium]|nr:hypothetical protein [Nitrospiraceae bacterium]